MELEESNLLLSDLLMKRKRYRELPEVSIGPLHLQSPFPLLDLSQSVQNLNNAQRLKRFLQDSGQEVSDEDIYLVVRQYSADQNGRLSYDDFSHLVLPSTNEIIASLAQNRLFPDTPDEKVNFYFQSLLNSEVKLQRELEDVKAALFNSRNFSLWKSFEFLNKSGSGAINEEEVREFLRGFKKYITSEDYDALMRRIDLEDDLVINYNEFLEGLIPMQMPGNGENRVKTSESKKDEEREEEQVEKKEGEKSVEEGNFYTDEPLDSQELEVSPKFNDPKEFTLSGQFETPEKGKAKPRPGKKLQEHQEKVAEIWLKELETEKKYEFLRENLIMQSNFSFIKLFELIDTESKGEIYMLDFENFLKSLNIPTNQSSILQVFTRYSSSDLVLSQDDFFTIFACQDEEYFEYLRENEVTEDLMQETVDRIGEFFSFILDNEANICKLKNRLIELDKKELQELFEGFDLNKDGVIDGEDLRNALRKFGVMCAGKDLRSLMRRYAEESIELEVFCKKIVWKDEFEDS